MIIYGKFKDNDLILLHSGESFKTDTGETVFTSNPTFLLNYGWKEIIYTEAEQIDGYYIAGFTWVEDDKTITQTWNYSEAEIVVSDDTIEDNVENYEITLEERVSALEDALLEMMLDG